MNKFNLAVLLSFMASLAMPCHAMKRPLDEPDLEEGVAQGGQPSSKRAESRLAGEPARDAFTVINEVRDRLRSGGWAPLSWEELFQPSEKTNPFGLEESSPQAITEISAAAGSIYDKYLGRPFSLQLDHGYHSAREVQYYAHLASALMYERLGDHLKAAPLFFLAASDARKTAEASPNNDYGRWYAEENDAWNATAMAAAQKGAEHYRACGQHKTAIDELELLAESFSEDGALRGKGHEEEVGTRAFKQEREAYDLAATILGEVAMKQTAADRAKTLEKAGGLFGKAFNFEASRAAWLEAAALFASIKMHHDAARMHRLRAQDFALAAENAKKEGNLESVAQHTKAMKNEKDQADLQELIAAQANPELSPKGSIRRHSATVDKIVASQLQTRALLSREREASLDREAVSTYFSHHLEAAKSFFGIAISAAEADQPHKAQRKINEALVRWEAVQDRMEENPETTAEFQETIQEVGRLFESAQEAANISRERLQARTEPAADYVDEEFDEEETATTIQRLEQEAALTHAELVDLTRDFCREWPTLEQQGNDAYHKHYCSGELPPHPLNSSQYANHTRSANQSRSLYIQDYGTLKNYLAEKQLEIEAIADKHEKCARKGVFKFQLNLLRVLEQTRRWAKDHAAEHRNALERLPAWRTNPGYAGFEESPAWNSYLAVNYRIGTIATEGHLKFYDCMDRYCSLLIEKELLRKKLRDLAKRAQRKPSAARRKEEESAREDEKAATIAARRALVLERRQTRAAIEQASDS